MSVDIDSSLYDPAVGHRIYNGYIDQLEFAAEVGFDGVGIDGITPTPTA